MLRPPSPAFKGKLGENNHFVLLHRSRYKPPNTEISVPLVYAASYFLETLSKYDGANEKGKK